MKSNLSKVKIVSIKSTNLIQPNIEISAKLSNYHQLTISISKFMGRLKMKFQNVRIKRKCTLFFISWDIEFHFQTGLSIQLKIGPFEIFRRAMQIVLQITKSKWTKRAWSPNNFLQFSLRTPSPLNPDPRVLEAKDIASHTLRWSRSSIHRRRFPQNHITPSIIIAIKYRLNPRGPRRDAERTAVVAPQGGSSLEAVAVGGSSRSRIAPRRPRWPLVYFLTRFPAPTPLAL